MLFTMFLLFLKLGALSIGGGYTLMSLIFAEANAMVGLTSQEFADMAALELMASGPIAINAATYVGFIKIGILGSVVATTAFIIPSIVFCSIVYYFLKRFSHSKILGDFMNAIKTATGGLMLATAFVLGKDIFFAEGASLLAIGTPLGALNLVSLAIAAVSLFVLVKFKASPIAVILGAAVVGIFLL